MAAGPRRPADPGVRAEIDAAVMRGSAADAGEPSCAGPTAASSPASGRDRPEGLADAVLIAVVVGRAVAIAVTGVDRRAFAPSAGIALIAALARGKRNHE